MPTADLPQANRLDDVVRTVEAVNSGRTSDAEIAAFLLRSSDITANRRRHGRYYRQAAELLGFIENANNRSQVSDDGNELLRVQSTQPRLLGAFLAQRVLSLPSASAVVDYIQEHTGCERRDLSELLTATFEGSSSTSERRLSTLLKWLEQLNIVRMVGHGYILVWRPEAGGAQVVGNGVLDFSRPTAPLLRDLNQIWSGARQTGGLSSSDALAAARKIADDAAREQRAEQASVRHQELLKRLAEVVRSKGAVPQFTQYIDLYAAVSLNRYVCEIKSCDQQNLIDQARKAVSQLYEYRYRYDLTDANLVLVLEVEPVGVNRWYIDYLVKDRDIMICWAEPPRSFAFPEECRQTLAPLLG